MIFYSSFFVKTNLLQLSELWILIITHTPAWHAEELACLGVKLCVLEACKPGRCSGRRYL